LTESADVTRPPTAEEFLALMGYLAEQGIEATLVGSAAVVHHLRNSPHGFRPTFDVDIHVNKQLPPLPAGWRKDQTAVGVNSWISPSGGIVDFLTPGHRFPSGEIVPRRVGRQTASDGNYAVAEINDLIRTSVQMPSESNPSLFSHFDVRLAPQRMQLACQPMIISTYV
jgi:hypothetical protein